MTAENGRWWRWNLVLLGAVLLLGLCLRLYYAINVSLYIDEFTTIWAAQRALSHGLPRLPLGAIYTQGLLYTYLEAGALFLGGGYHPLVARIPSLVLSVATLALTVFAARRLFHLLPVGLAALWLAVDGEAIAWGARARTYALLQVVLLGAFLAWYEGAVADDRPGPRWLAIGLLLVALVDQQVTLLVLPPLAILALVARGWSWLRKPVVWIQVGVMVVGIAARWLLYQFMVLPGTAATTAPRVFVDLTQPLAGWRTLASFLTGPNRLLPVLLLVGGVLWLLVRRQSGLTSWGRPVLSITFVLGVVILEMVLFVGTTWRRPRYLYPLLPLLFLGAEGVAVPALRGLARRLSFLPLQKALVGLTVVFALLLLGMAYPSTRAAATHVEWGYDRAFAAVGRAWAEGDALATISPAAAFVVLDRADYLAVEEGAQVLVVERDGRRLDSWTGLPLLDSPAKLLEALEAHDRLWFVVDEMRLDRHFSPDYLRLLWERFDLAAVEGGALVFLSRPEDGMPAADQPVEVDLGGHLYLESYALSAAELEPGQELTVTLRWRPVSPEQAYVTYVRLVDQDGAPVAVHEAPPLGGLYPATRWPLLPRSQPLPDRHILTLPEGLPPGRYRLDAGIKLGETLEPVGDPIILDYVLVDNGSTEGMEQQAPAVRFGDAVALLSHDLVGEIGPGKTTVLRLSWQTGPDGLDADYTVFVHLLDADGNIAQQWDAPPTGGWYPTSYWDPGEVVLDDHELYVSPDLTPGDYRIIIGLYSAGGDRLLLDDGSDWFRVANVELGP